MKRIILFLGIILLLPALIIGCAPSGTTLPIVTSFIANPTTIDEGDNSTLSWAVTGANSVMIAPEVGSVGLTGNFLVSPTETTTYILTATNSAGSITANVTVTVSTVLKKVIDAVKEDILPDIPEVQLGEPYWCLLLDNTPLPAGTSIEEDSDIPVKAKANIILQEERYFFYLDLAPGAYYAHPVKYLLVDEEGNHEEYDANWWPRIGGQVPESLVKDIPDEEDVIASNVELVYPIGTVMDYILPELVSLWVEGFIVVQGVLSSESNYSDAMYTYWNGMNFFNSYKNAYSEVTGLVQSQATQILDEIEQMVEEGKKVITIYIIAHGDVDLVKLGGQWFSATQFKNKMALYPNVIFNFILGSCHSGSVINDLSTLDNVCVVETACASGENAWPDKDYIGGTGDINPLDVGSEWTNSLIEAMDIIASDSSKMSSIQTWASNNEVPVTSMLICQGGYGALGVQPTLGLTDDYDLTHVLGWTTPSRYCSYEFSIY
jgi:hypothetical protein